MATVTAILAAAAAAQAGTAPTLGISRAPSQEGYGQVEPRTIFNGGDPTGLVTHVHWTHWGQPRAMGSGIGDWVWPGLSVAGGSTPVRATVVAFDLGSCAGRPAYRKIAWYFPSRGQTFDARQFINICTGRYSTYQPRYARCGSASLIAPSGDASQIRATGVSCATARSIVGGTPAVSYARRGGRFRAHSLYCGTQGGGSLADPALFECAFGATDILFDVS
ncbi:MAG TPA: hypothetical protein VIK04_21260 [Solirubrobacteraceae bacterium]